MDDPTHQAPDGSPRSTTRVFAEWIERETEGRELDLDALCREHPDRATELRQMAAAFDALAGILSEIRDRRPSPRSMVLLSSLIGPIVRDGSAVEDRAAMEAIARRILDSIEPDPTDAPRYVDREQVGEGAMGRVFKAWDPRLRRHLARKALKQQSDGSTAPGQQVQFLARFLAEAQVTSQLQHPSIVPVHDLGIDRDGQLYYTMPLIRGSTLQDVFWRHTDGDPDWPLPRVLSLLIRVCEAIAFAHSRGVVHRDLKPTNIMVGEFGETYVMDWGLAYVQSQDTAPHPEWSAISTSRRELFSADDSPITTRKDHVLGTPPYMAPEQAADPASGTGPLSDVYSIGAILYELVTGSVPYRLEAPDGRAGTVLRLLRQGPPTPIGRLSPHTPRELTAIVDKAMARDPRERYATARDLATDLESFLGHRPTTATNLRPLALLRLAIRRNRAVFAVSTGAALLLIGGLVAFLLVQESGARARQRTLVFMSAQALIDQSEEVYPIHPDSAPRMQQWLARAAELLGAQDSFRAEAAANAATLPPTGEERQRMLGNMDSIRELVPRIEAHLSLARSLERICFVENAVAWDDAIAAIRASDRYHHLELPRQMGLVPLRLDPDSGLWEFWVVASGRRPRSRLESAGYDLDADSGLVLVLLPAAEATLGGTGYERSQENEQRWSVAVDPYFIGKYEVPQSVWTRVMYGNPSGRNAARKFETADYEYSWLNPVERVSWRDSIRLTDRLGLTLPTEVRWEHAAKGGADLTFGYGDDFRSLRSHENVRDLTFSPRKDSRSNLASGTVDWNDGYMFHAPIGTFSPNGYGLHDMLGNVSEWCLDPYQLHPTYRDGDGLQTVGSRPLRDAPVPGDVRLTLEPERCVRGGSFYMEYWYCRPSFRSFQAPDATHNTFGLRVARSVDGRGRQ